MNYSETHPDYCSLEVLTYKDGRLMLIEPILDHAEISLFWTSDASVIQYMGADLEVPSKENEIKRIDEIRNNLDEYNWMIELDGHVIGNVSINRIKETSAKFGSKAGNYTILIGDKKYWGKGIAFHVGITILEWAFSKCGFEGMSARALDENNASIGMLKKLGFEFMGKSTEWQNFKITKQRFFLLKTK